MTLDTFSDSDTECGSEKWMDEDFDHIVPPLPHCITSANQQFRSPSLNEEQVVENVPRAVRELCRFDISQIDQVGACLSCHFPCLLAMYALQDPTFRNRLPQVSDTITAFLDLVTRLRSKELEKLSALRIFYELS